MEKGPERRGLFALFEKPVGFRLSPHASAMLATDSLGSRDTRCMPFLPACLPSFLPSFLPFFLFFLLGDVLPEGRERKKGKSLQSLLKMD